MSSRETADFLRKAALARKLLTETLPQMQPSALKHEYLTSVANVLNHPVAQETAEDGTAYIIGFGDFSRTLPLVLICEAEPDLTVRHAFVPSLQNARELRLINQLQRHEHEWARERGLPQGRDIIAELRYYSRDFINQHGVNRYPAPPPFNDADKQALMRGEWYPTKLIESDHEIDHRGPPDLRSPTIDYSRMTSNLADSVNSTTGRSAPRAQAVHVQASAQGSLQVTDIEFEHDPHNDRDHEL